MSQAGLAKLLNVTQGAVYQWEKGISVPKSDNLAAMAGLLGVAYEWLATGRGSMAPSSGPAVRETTPTYGIGSLTSDEMRLVVAFRRLPARRRKAMLALIEEDH